METSRLLAQMRRPPTALIRVTDPCPGVAGAGPCARACRDQVVPAMAALRAPADQLEMLVDKDLWPFPSYGDLIFEV